MKTSSSLRMAVTGASGFLGSHMVAFLKEKHHWVRAIIRTPNRETKKLYNQANEVVSTNLSNEKSTIAALKHVDYVFHFAADMGGVGYFSQAQYVPFVGNMRMDLNILAACEANHVKRLFYPSSACAYPIDAAQRFKRTPKLRETMFLPANPDQMYGWEKLTMLLLSAHAPIETRVGVLHTIFGPGQEGTGKRAKFPAAITHKVIEAAASNSPIHIWGNGKQIRTFLYITDALEKMYEVMMHEKYFGPVNISADEQVTVVQCATWVCELAGIKPKFIFEKNKPTGVLLRGVDNSKFAKHYRYRNKVRTKEGFTLLYNHIKASASHASKT
jgi:GDP-D-mannose 3',5'-epimerase